MEDEVKVLLSNDNFAQLGTVNSDNTPHIDTVWFSYQDEKIVVATTMATKKGKNLQANPNGYIVVTNKDNPYEQAQIKVVLSSIQEDDDLAICDSIAMEYTGKPFPQRKHKGRVALVFGIIKVKYHVARV
jgi:general stress protein 26